jgi:hypothetical protein
MPMYIDPAQYGNYYEMTNSLGTGQPNPYRQLGPGGVAQNPMTELMQKFAPGGQGGPGEQNAFSDILGGGSIQPMGGTATPGMQMPGPGTQPMGGGPAPMSQPSGVGGLPSPSLGGQGSYFGGQQPQGGFGQQNNPFFAMNRSNPYQV